MARFPFHRALRRKPACALCGAPEQSCGIVADVPARDFRSSRDVYRLHESGDPARYLLVFPRGSAIPLAEAVRQHLIAWHDLTDAERSALRAHAGIVNRRKIREGVYSRVINQDWPGYLLVDEGDL